MTNDASKMYCVRPPPLDQQGVIASDGTRLRLECIGNIGADNAGRRFVCTRFEVIFFSFYKAQQTYVIISDAAGAHIMGENLTFPCEKSGSYLRATRLVSGTVKAKPRTNRALLIASQISAPLSSCVPSFPLSASKVADPYERREESIGWAGGAQFDARYGKAARC